MTAPDAIIGHGVDLVEIPRIQRILADHGERFVDRCFTAGEREYAEAGQKQRVERYAVRFACKEAVLKAIGTGWTAGIRWREIEVTRTPAGAPELRISGRCAELAADLGITRWHVSLSHTGGFALASVLGCGPPAR